MESLVCLQILRPPRNSQGTSRRVGHTGAYIPATIRIVGPSIHAKLVLESFRKTLCEYENEVEISVEML